MEYLRGWRALRKDPQWITKVLIGTLASFVPLVGPLVLSGWRALMLRRAVSGQDAPLPRLDFDFEYLKNLVLTGFKGFLAQLLWSLPLVVVVMVSYFGCIIGGVVAARATGGGDEAGLAMFVVVLAFCVIFPILIIVTSLPLNIATLRAELTDDLGVAMRMKDVFAMTRLMLKELIVGQLVMMAIGIGIMLPFGLITLSLGLYPAAIVMQVIQAYWLAEIYKRYLEKGGEPLAIGPLDVPGTVPQQYVPPPPAQF